MHSKEFKDHATGYRPSLPSFHSIGYLLLLTWIKFHQIQKLHLHVLVALSQAWTKMLTDLSVGSLSDNIIFCGHVAHGECWANRIYLQNLYTHPGYALALYGRKLHHFYNNMSNGSTSTLLQSCIGFYILKRALDNMMLLEIGLARERLLVKHQTETNIVKMAWEKECA